MANDSPMSFFKASSLNVQGHSDWSASKFIVVVTLANMIIYHIPLYSFLTNNLNYLSIGGIATFITALVALFAITFLILSLVTIIVPPLIKPFCMILALTNSIAVYFVVTYHVILGKNMMGNAFNTRATEAMDLFHPMLLVYIFFLGVIPSFLLLKMRMNKVRRLRLLLHTLGILLVTLVIAYLNSASWLWFDKHAKHLGGIVMPWSYTINAIRYQGAQSNAPAKLLPKAVFNNNQKMLVVLVIGESARSHNFSLYGYNRATNPLLEKDGVVALKQTQSSSTYTTASVASILSHNGSHGVYEPLPSYLKRHGADVIWRTSNWGQPHIDVNSFQTEGELVGQCEGKGCSYDEVLLTGLKTRIQSSDKQKIFVTLHTKGSHGPSYYMKYPKKFEVFTPVCKSVELSNCSNQELINAYDNAILYTDYFLDKTIKLLKQLKDIPTLFIYISDHGESLGEYGLYLHGTPFSIAPEVQKNIPFIIWTSDSFKKLARYQGLVLNLDGPYSQHNIFHTVMGAFDMHSPIYKPSLDLLKIKK